MGIIKLYTISNSNSSQQFILKDYPELECFTSQATKKDIKRIDIEQYFRSIDKDYKDYTKIMYGPVFGMEDSRNGFVYEDNDGEILIVDENEIPVTHENCLVLMCELSGRLKTSTLNLNRGVLTSYNDMDSIQDRITEKELYNELIRDEWIPNKSFLIIE